MKKVIIIFLFSFNLNAETQGIVPVVGKIASVFDNISEGWKYKRYFRMTPFYLIPYYDSRLTKLKIYLIKRGCEVK